MNELNRLSLLQTSSYVSRSSLKNWWKVS